MVEEWMKKVNEIMNRHRFRSGRIFVRFNATKYPHPTISIVIYDGGRKVLEKPIKYLDDFVNDLLLVKTILDEVRLSHHRNNSGIGSGESSVKKPTYKTKTVRHKKPEFLSRLSSEESNSERTRIDNDESDNY